MNEWPLVSLGEVMSEVDRPVDVSTVSEVPWAGVRWYAEGVYPRPVENASRVKTKTLNRLAIGDITYNRMWATKAAFGVVGKDSDGCLVSGDFPAFVGDPNRLLPGYMRLVFQTADFQQEASVRAVGTTERRRLKEPEFLCIPIALPPLAEQRRIVAVMAAVDSQIMALERGLSAARLLLRRYLESGFPSQGVAARAIVDLCETVIGGIWGSPEGESEVDVLALGPRVYGFGTTLVRTEGSPVRSFSTRQVAKRLVREGDIVLERSGGSADQPVARVVIGGPGLEPCVPTDFQRLLRPDPDKVLPRFLFWRLQADWNAGLSRNYSRRTTGITNLSVKDYIAREISVPTLAEQRSIVEIADCMEATAAALAAELASLRIVRTDLLSALLTRKIAVDETVDRYVEAGVEGVA